MPALNESDRRLIATALAVYIAYCERPSKEPGDPANPALAELRPIEAWWGRVMAGYLSERESDHQLAFDLRQYQGTNLSYQARAWIDTALKFYVRFCDGEADIGGQRDDAQALAAQAIRTRWYAAFFGAS